MQFFDQKKEIFFVFQIITPAIAQIRLKKQCKNNRATVVQNLLITVDIDIFVYGFLLSS